MVPSRNKTARWRRAVKRLRQRFRGLETRRLLDAGRRANEAGDWPAASAAYTKCMEIDPSREDLWVHYGHEANRAGHKDEAEAAYRRAIALDPGTADTYMHLGHLLMASSRFAEARQAYADAFERDPSLILAQIEMMEATRKGSLDAMPSSEGELPGSSQSAGAGTKGASPDRYGLGERFSKIGSLIKAALQPRAFKHMQERLLASRIGRLLDVCRRAQEAGDWPAARAAYLACFEIDPSREDLWIHYGHKANQSGHKDEAEAAYRRAIALKPEIADTYMHLGHLLMAGARFSEAKRAYAAAFERDRSLVLAQVEMMEAARRERLLTAPVREGGLPRSLQSVIIGTTGLCNASCLSCPTGKPETDNNPRVPMTMALFEKIVRSIAEHDYVIMDQVSFGLFGDGLVDPFVNERTRLARSLLPDARIVVNTNGAAYNRKRHAGLIEHATFIGLHVESLTAETYDLLMQPLKAKNVFPKVEQILEDFPKRVFVSVPVSQYNVNELRRIQDYFLERGAYCVNFDPLWNRCSEHAEPFRSMALDPVQVACPSDLLDSLIVDCDGSVLVCCQDFKRQEPIGNLTQESFGEVMSNAARRAMRERFDEGRHGEMKTCRNCFADTCKDLATLQQKARSLAEPARQRRDAAMSLEAS